MILTLIKINLIAMFAGIFRKYRKDRKVRPASVVLIGLLAVYVVGAMLFTFGAMFNGMAGPFFEAGIGWFYFALAGLVVFAICFVSGVFMVQAQIFSARDNELLLSMPVKPGAILGGRLAALMIIEYLFEIMVLIPVFVVLLINGYISAIPAAGIVFFFITAVLLPLIALALGCFVGWIVALISSRIRRKNIPTLILSLAFLVAYFWVYSRMMGNLNTLLVSGTQIAEAVRRAVFPAYHYGLAIADGNVLSFLIFAACAIIPFAIMYALLSVSFMKLATGGKSAKKVKYREKALRASGAGLALLKRELMHFWSLPMYIMNASMGAITTVVLAVLLAVRPALLLGMFDPQTGALAGLIDPGITGAIVLAALAMMNSISAPSISLEGKRLWIVKSLPVTARDILMAKAGMHIAISGIPAVLAGIACIAVIPMNWLQITLTLVLPAVVTLMVALLGLALNLTFPRFDWINPIQPVKQGLSAMLTIFGGMAMILVLVLVYAFLPREALTLESYLLICAAAFATASAGLYLHLAGAGCRKFDTL